MQKNTFIVLIQSGLLALIGLGLVIQSTLRFIDQHLHIGHAKLIDPFGVSPGIVLTIVGMVLIFLVPYLYQRRRIAYITALPFTMLASVTMIFEHRHALILLILQIVFMVWMALSLRIYHVKSDLVSLRLGIRIAVLVGVIGLLYGCISILVLGMPAFHQSFTLAQAIATSFQIMFTFKDIATPTVESEFLVNSLNVIGVVVFLLIVTSLFKPVRFALISHTHDRLRATKILANASTSTEDYFKVWPADKHYYFSSSGASFIAYKTAGHTALILGDPCGDPNEFSELFNAFYEFVSANGWKVAVVNGTAATKKLYGQQGLRPLFIGNEAVVDIPHFMNETIRSKHFRHAFNKAQKETLETEYWTSIDDTQMKQLKHVSDSWLSRRGRKEYTFIMGYFDPAYLRSGTVMVLKQHGTVIAYISCIPTFIETAASIDHLRFVTDAPSVSMHYLLAKLIGQLANTGKTSLNIGLAPLSGIETEQGQKRSASNLLKMIKKLGNRLYSFRGVEQFKGKSSPRWHPRYLYYTGTLASLTRITTDLDRASRVNHTEKPKLIATIVVVLVLLALMQWI